MTQQDTGAKKPDEIMAEYLLKGGKMLAKTCPKCGSPLFEYKGETLCVVCNSKEEKGIHAGENFFASDGRKSAAPRTSGDLREMMEPASPGNEDIEAEIRATIIHLCSRVRAESDPENCLLLMDCVAQGVEALKALRQR